MAGPFAVRCHTVIGKDETKTAAYRNTFALAMVRLEFYWTLDYVKEIWIEHDGRKCPSTYRQK